REIVRALNHCIEICTDGEKGYAAAAADVRAPALKASFQEKAKQRADFVLELQAVIQQLGGYPENEGTARGTVHRGWIDLRLAVEGREDHLLLEECVRGETAAIEAFKKAIQRTPLDTLPRDLRSLVQRQYSTIQASLEEARQKLAMMH